MHFRLGFSRSLVLYNSKCTRLSSWCLCGWSQHRLCRILEFYTPRQLLRFLCFTLSRASVCRRNTSEGILQCRSAFASTLLARSNFHLNLVSLYLEMVVLLFCCFSSICSGCPLRREVCRLPPADARETTFYCCTSTYW